MDQWDQFSPGEFQAVGSALFEKLGSGDIAFEGFIETCRQITDLAKKDPSQATVFVAQQLQPNVDARVFEIVSTISPQKTSCWSCGATSRRAAGPTSSTSTAASPARRTAGRRSISSSRTCVATAYKASSAGGWIGLGATCASSCYCSTNGSRAASRSSPSARVSTRAPAPDDSSPLRTGTRCRRAGSWGSPRSVANLIGGGGWWGSNQEYRPRRLKAPRQ